MKIKVRFFAAAKQAAGAADGALELPAGATVQDAVARCVGQFPGLAPLLPSVSLVVALEKATGDRVLQDGDELAFIPPVSGGRGRPVRHG